MSRRRQKGKGKKRPKDFHRKTRSPETKVWEDEHLIPERPPWMDPETYQKLARARFDL